MWTKDDSKRLATVVAFSAAVTAVAKKSSWQTANRVAALATAGAVTVSAIYLGAKAVSRIMRGVKHNGNDR